MRSIEAYPTNQAARDALAIYSEALDAVRADALVARALSVDDGTLRVGDQAFDLAMFGRVLVIGAGKASTSMAQAVEGVLGNHLSGGVVVTKHGHGGPTLRITVLEAGHPAPDAASIAGGEAVARVALDAGHGDLVIVLISGGASALMELPRAGITLDDIRATTDALLRCGAAIGEINAVRACVSQLKAGGLARMIAPAQAVCLVLSDVLGSPLQTIGSGPCVVGSDAASRAYGVLGKYELIGSVPESVVEAARTDASEQPPRADAAPPHILIGDINTALDAAAGAARSLGHRSIIVTGMMQGEAREIALTLAGAARDLPRLSDRDGIDCLLFGGETTVTVRGDGVGGRCQEIACAAVSVLDGTDLMCLLAAGTDGTDGPTDAAGALVDGGTAGRAADAGLSPADALARSDTYGLLDRLGCLIRTGPTGSNVGDLVIALVS